jgi:DnaJ-domain-containing protein 1
MDQLLAASPSPIGTKPKQTSRAHAYLAYTMSHSFSTFPFFARSNRQTAAAAMTALRRPPANTLLRPVLPLLLHVLLLLLLDPLHAFRPPLSSSFSSSPPSSSRPPRTRLSATTKTDYYSVLGLAPGATPAEVKRAFRERAKNTHPDASRTTDTTKEFLVIKEAYETLYDARRRAEFDRRRQMAEVADLAFSVGEILTMDIAVPLGKREGGKEGRKGSL